MDIDLSVYEKSSADTMAGKRKQMSTPQKEVVISLFEDGVNQRRVTSFYFLFLSAILMTHFWPYTVHSSGRNIRADTDTVRSLT
jgi:hypothetical protein